MDKNIILILKAQRDRRIKEKEEANKMNSLFDKQLILVEETSKVDNLEVYIYKEANEKDLYYINNSIGAMLISDVLEINDLINKGLTPDNDKRLKELYKKYRLKHSARIMVYKEA